MSLYGYELSTTPRLQSLADAGNLYVFSDVISSAHGTTVALQNVLTFANNENRLQTPWFKQMNLISALNLLGYNTTFLSTQEPSGYGNTTQAIASNAHILDYAVLHKLNKKRDERLLEMYANLGARSNEVLFLHILGTHTSYKVRYPSDFDKFSVSTLRENGLDRYVGGAKKGEVLGFRATRNRARYLNAVLYNDFVVSEIMQNFADEEAIVFYFSDHADEVYDSRNFAGHSGDTHYELEIPFMVFMSDKFKAKHPQIVARVQNALDKPFMTDNFIHAFFDLLDIECIELDKTLSPFNAEFNASRTRIVDKKDYDKVVREFR